MLQSDWLLGGPLFLIETYTLLIETYKPLMHRDLQAFHRDLQVFYMKCWAWSWLQTCSFPILAAAATCKLAS